MVKITKVNKNYNEINVLKNLSMNFEKGKVSGILGPSGCGKSTILKLISGLELQQNGDILNLSNNLGFIFQESRLLKWLNVYKNLELVLKDRIKSREKRKEMINNILEKVQLSEKKNFMPSQLSGGMKQRVSIARALIIKPDLLLMDEPFSNLDFHLRLDLIELMNTIFKEENITGIFVTHDSREAFLMCDTVYVMKNRDVSLKKIILKTPKFLRKINSDLFFDFEKNINSFSLNEKIEKLCKCQEGLY